MNLQRAEMIAKDLMKHHLGSFTFGFDKAKRRFGYCINRINDNPFISLSKALTELNSEEQFIDTVLHEIAHALTPKAHHGRKWKQVALSIGCNGQRCYDSDAVVKPSAKFTGTCPSCFKEIERLRRKRIACSACCDKNNGGKFDSRFLFNWVKAD